MSSQRQDTKLDPTGIMGKYIAKSYDITFSRSFFSSVAKDAAKQFVSEGVHGLKVRDYAVYIPPQQIDRLYEKVKEMVKTQIKEGPLEGRGVRPNHLDSDEQTREKLGKNIAAISDLEKQTIFENELALAALKNDRDIDLVLDDCEP